MTETLVPADLIIPADCRYEEARQAWNLAVDQRPAAVALPRSAAEVAAAVRAAAATGLRVAVQGTGHNAEPLGDLSDTVLVRTSGMRDVTVAPAAQLARVEAGAVWSDVVGPAAEHGLFPLAGSSHDVGVVGYSLGGGMGWPGVTGCPPRAWWPPRWSPRTVGCCGWTRCASRSCSGRCVAAAATSPR